jgi:hypothetical protein
MTMDKTRLHELAEYYDTHSTADELEGATFEPADAPPKSERMTTFAVRMPVDMLERARDLARIQNVTVSALLRRWIHEGMVRTARKVDTRGHGTAPEAFVSVEDVVAAVESLASKARPAPTRSGVAAEMTGHAGSIEFGYALHWVDADDPSVGRTLSGPEAEEVRQQFSLNKRQEPPF